MSIGTFTNHPSPPPVQSATGTTAGGFDQLIEEQLRKTRAQVKLVDIVSNTLLLIVGAFSFMLLVAVVDHWVMALGFWTRLLALAVLLGGSIWWIVTRIAPLVMRRINPVYAAHTIEQAEPSLKNSLINFLLLRNQQQHLHAVVYQAVGQRAASDISHVPAENVVDYSHLLKIGYVLAALLVVGAVYKIVSPKDPFQSAARIVAPWASIDRPSRVEIAEVTPVDISIFQGEHVDVSAAVRGVGKRDEVRVLFSTIDGQVVDQPVAMLLSEDGLHHTASIPSGEYGAQTSLQYRVVAGDAQTRWYNVEVVPAPHVLVTKVRYEPPRYTGREVFDEPRGDISGLEGTRVRVFARANRPIESAYLELDPLPAGVTPEAAAASGAESVRIEQIDGQQLQASFYLRLAADRKTPWHKTYTIRFTTDDGHRNREPIVHIIDVKPDLAPLVEILSPREAEVELPLNGKLEIETRAIDHDFALSRVRLAAVSGGRDLLDATLLEAPRGHLGQAMGKFEFKPQEYELEVGDVVEYWAIAADNRTAISSNSPEPNVTRTTPSYRITITEPRREERDPAGDAAAEDMTREPGDEADPSSGGKPQDASGTGETGSEDENPKDKNKDKPDEGSESSKDESGTGGNNGGSGSSAESDNASEEAKDSGSDSGSEGGNAGGSSESNSESSDSSNEGQSGGSASKSGGSDSQSSEGSSNSGQQSGEGGGQSGPSDQPIENDGSRDGDVFDAINEHRQQQEQGDNASAGGGQSDAGAGDDLKDKDLNSQGGQQGSDAGGQAGETKPPGDQQGAGESGGASSGSQNQSGQKDGDSQAGGESGNQAGQKPQDGQSGNSESGGSQAQEQEPGNKSGGQKDSPQNAGGAQDQQNKDASGGQSQGGQPQGGQKPEGNKEQQGGGEGEQPMGGGQGENDQSGAGEKTDGGGSPQSQSEQEKQGNKQKSGGSKQGGQNQEQGGKSPAGSNKDSQSQGGSGGDRKGGGEQGGGQSAKKPGQDSAGSGQSGEQGDGAANDPGSGQSGNRGGGDQIANSPTGRSGEQAGEGSNTGQASGGQQPNSKPESGNAQPSGDPSSGSNPGGGQPQDSSADPQNQDGDQITNTAGEGRGTMPTGGGKPADNHPSDTPLPDTEPGGDKANLDYARQATDLTLEYLKDQKHKPDPELLDKLGWSKADLENFIQRWERMKNTARSSGADSVEARRLDDSLRSLGLRPHGDKQRTGPTGNRQLTGQRDSGARTRPPKEYAEQYRAFSKFITPAGE